VKWTAAKKQAWLTLSSTGGTLAAGASTTVTASFGTGANALVVGSYSDLITFTNTTNGSGNTTRSVGLTVNPALSVTPGSGLVSSGPAGGPFTPSNAIYTVYNLGSASLKWTATKKQAWLTLSSSGGTLAGGAHVTVTVSFNSSANALAAGSYSDAVIFASSSNSITESVSLTVNPTLSVSSTSGLVSSGYAGGPFVASSIGYTLHNSGSVSMKWTAGKTQPWITLSSTGGTLAGGASTTVTVSINSSANSLTAGSYSDTVTFGSPSNSTTRGVSLTVNPALYISPTTGFSSSGDTGGPFTPSSATYTLKNLGGASLKWTATKAQTWLTLSSAGSSLAAGATTTVTVSLNSGANKLAAGVHTDTVKFTDPTNPKVTTTQSVTLTVTAP
jgi:hypothetical protein